MDAVMIFLMLFLAGLVFALPSQYVMSRILRKRGMRTYFLFFQPSDLKKIFEMMKQEKDMRRKKKMKNLIVSYLIPLSIALLSFLSLAVIALSG